jgi:hypothetical protein
LERSLGQVPGLIAELSPPFECVLPKLPAMAWPVSLLTLALYLCSAASSRPDDLPSPPATTSCVSTVSGQATAGGGPKFILARTRTPVPRALLTPMLGEQRDSITGTPRKPTAPSGFAPRQSSEITRSQTSIGRPHMTANWRFSKIGRSHKPAHQP